MVMSYKTHFTRLHYEGRLLALHTNVWVGWKLLVGVNTLAYSAVLLLATLKMELPYNTALLQDSSLGDMCSYCAHKHETQT
jgi:hypothetical protein